MMEEQKNITIVNGIPIDYNTKEKDILQAIVPWLITGTCVLGLIAAIYVMYNAFG